MIILELGQVPRENPNAKKSSEVAFSRGTKEQWRDLIQAVREECTAHPTTSMGLFVHASRATGSASKLVYNAQLLEVLTKTKMDLNTEVHIRFAATASQQRRKPRTASCAKHASAAGRKGN
eukprot:5396799-Alexandrium_andersonii.AAC.1